MLFACQQSSVTAGIVMFYDLTTIIHYCYCNISGFDVPAILKFADFHFTSKSPKILKNMSKKLF